MLEIDIQRQRQRLKQEQLNQHPLMDQFKSQLIKLKQALAMPSLYMGDISLSIEGNPYYSMGRVRGKGCSFIGWRSSIRGEGPYYLMGGSRSNSRVPSNRATGKEEASELDRGPDPIEAPVEALIDDPVTPARNLLKFTAYR